jgi:hypothetical protein
MAILIGIVPSITARKGLAGRTKVGKAFEHYFRTGGHEKGSVLIRNRFESIAKNGVTLEDNARYEVGGAIAILVNTAPAVFVSIYISLMVSRSFSILWSLLSFILGSKIDFPEGSLLEIFLEQKLD